MAGLSMTDFEEQMRDVCSKSSVVKSVNLFASTENSNLWRILLKNDTAVDVDISFVDAYYSNAGKISFAHIKNNVRIFGADNAGGRWHWHPYEDPQRHDFVDKEIAFAEFLKHIEENLSK
jgi:hypothetical protein